MDNTNNRNEMIDSELQTEIHPRYSRHVLFAPIGREGQAKLGTAKVAIVGLGALGSVLANHMVRAGVGEVRLIDRDYVEDSNLQRQMLYDEADAEEATPKAVAAANKLSKINSLVNLEPIVADLNPLNAKQLLGGCDLILDGTDNFSVRFLMNDFAIKRGVPWIYGGAVASRGVSMNIIPGKTPCLRCLFPHAPQQGTAETCDTAGVIGPIVHVVASYQAAEALKLLTGHTEALNLKMQQWDLWTNYTSAIDVSRARKSDCPACGLGHFEYADAVADSDTLQSLCGRDTVQIVPAKPAALTLEQWENRLSPLGSVERNRFLLKFRPDSDLCMVLFPDGRTLIQGTNDLVRAKSLYARYMGM
jgi:molybdopterin/thiamine biosynthesis adenylyltransferase